jgi:hypothetical protein
MSPRLCHRAIGDGGFAAAAQLGQLETLPPGGLSGEQESLGELALTAKLKGAEILVSGALGGFWLRFAPEFQPVKVFGADLTLSKALKEMVAESRREVCPLDLGHLFAKCHARQLFLQLLPLGGIMGLGQAVSERKETLLFTVSCFETRLDQVNENAIRAHLLTLRKRLHALGQTSRK